jgi:hypothetical protein
MARHALEVSGGGMDTSVEQRFPLPIKGWNTRDPLDEMRPDFALKMDNILPRTYYCELRGGQENWATGLAGTATDSLMPYTSPTTKKLFAAASTFIYDASAQGVVGAAVVSGLTNARWQHTMFSGAYGTYYLMMVNGADLGRQYDGAAWANLVTTGVTSDNFSNITAHKSRLWFVRKDSLSPYYLPLFAITGVATEFNIGGLFKKGGYLLSVGALTLDAGIGSDDLFVFASSEGEVVVYRGTDPATNFTLVGIYEIPKPIGARCLQKYGGDLAVITQQGIYAMSKGFLSMSIDRAQEMTYNISPTFQSDAASFASTFGWQFALHTEQNLLIVNVPSTTAGGVAVQYLMNTITGAWSRFLGLNCTSICIFNGNLMIGMSGKVVRLFQVTNDFGANITGEIITAFNYLNRSPKNKHVNMLRAHMNLTASLALELAVLGDFKFSNPDYQPADVILPNSTFGGVWDSAVWDASYWAYGDFPPLDWKTVFANPSSVIALGLRMATKSGTVRLSALDILYTKGGVL